MLIGLALQSGIYMQRGREMRNRAAEWAADEKRHREFSEGTWADILENLSRSEARNAASRDRLAGVHKRLTAKLYTPGASKSPDDDKKRLDAKFDKAFADMDVADKLRALEHRTIIAQDIGMSRVAFKRAEDCELLKAKYIKASWTPWATPDPDPNGFPSLEDQTPPVEEVDMLLRQGYERAMKPER